jgi:hypothetical protein
MQPVFSQEILSAFEKSNEREKNNNSRDAENVDDDDDDVFDEISPPL